MSKLQIKRIRLLIQGQVQGVGFRPYIYTLAHKKNLSGFIFNNFEGVVIEVQGPEKDVDIFASVLPLELPPLAGISKISIEKCEVKDGENTFSINPSVSGKRHSVLISPDTSVCADCLADMDDLAGRRYKYPFTNCTNCGPRYTITKSIPYDRKLTSMACFAMCPECQAEYSNPLNRRFHAQPNACTHCGPHLHYVPAGQQSLNTAFLPEQIEKTPDIAAIRNCVADLLASRIVAIKGLGGFNLACNACCDKAVGLLRERKNRPHKAFAVMVPSIEEARLIASVGPQEEALLISPQRPIVICPTLSNDYPFSSAAREQLSGLIAPDTSTVGIMLPYTPLHKVLIDEFKIRLEEKRNNQIAENYGFPEQQQPTVLVMTSGNVGGEPICLGNREALLKLDGLADSFVLHNRDILVRIDDSVTRPHAGGGICFFRRARGFVPVPISLPAALTQGKQQNSVAQPQSNMENDDFCVLGVGAELKNTLCLSKGNKAFLSQHVGDMSNLETAAFYREMLEHFISILQCEPDLIVRDLHPDYMSSNIAEEQAAIFGVEVLSLQHHYAHAHALLAEHAHDGPAIVLTLDGTGLGDDGMLWGGEALFVDTSAGPKHRRLAHFNPLPLPGGEAAVFQPWRTAHAALLLLGLLPEKIQTRHHFLYVPEKISAICQTQKSKTTKLPWLPDFTTAAAMLPAMLEKNLNSPLSTSCGRLFDAVAAMLGLCNESSYEGQAAIRLEEAQYRQAQRGGSGLSPEITLDDEALSRALSGAFSRGADLPSATSRALTDSNNKISGAEQISPESIVPDTGAKHLSTVPCGGSRILYPCSIEKSRIDANCLSLNSLELLAAVWSDVQKGTPVPAIARCFHASLAFHLAELAGRLANENGVSHIGLSGGCMQNMTLTMMLTQCLESKGLLVFTHKRTPPGDGSISLGQAAYGRLVQKTARADLF